MLLKDLDLKLQYRSSTDSIARDFLVPALSRSVLYQRAVGFFSSTSLIQVSYGICGLVKNSGRIQIVASPRLSQEDIEAIRAGYEEREAVIARSLLRSLDEPLSASRDEQRLRLVAYLVSHGVMDIKIAFAESDSEIGLYHEKIGVIADAEDNVVAFTGSLNETGQAFNSNFESIMVFSSWKEADSSRVAAIRSSFDGLWSNGTRGLQVIDFPRAPLERLLRYSQGTPDFNIDSEEFGSAWVSAKPSWTSQLPVRLYDYQIQAIENWEMNGFLGTFDMATGSGKTFTALAGMLRLADYCNGNLLTLIACPFVHLVDQWAEDVRKCGIEPLVCHSGAPLREWKMFLDRAIKRTLLGSDTPQVALITNIALAGQDVQTILRRLSPSDNVLLIADEAHYLGARKLSSALNDRIRYRLALSATLERCRDDEGTTLLRSYFGEQCIRYDLEKAIAEGRLVPYEYYPVLIHLNSSELAEYRRLSDRIRKHVRIDGRGRKSLDDTGQMIAFKRSRLVAGAAHKVMKLAELMENYRHDTHILVYCGATNGLGQYGGGREIDRQIDEVQRLLGCELGMTVHKFTAEENAIQRVRLRELFADGDYQALIAIRCLDEGVNIPETRTAFILASSRNPKEYVQRRGRVLRKAKGKDKAVIYDFVALPRSLHEITPDHAEEDMSLVSGEVNRMRIYAESALNPSETDVILWRLTEAYGLDQIGNQASNEWE